MYLFAGEIYSIYKVEGQNNQQTNWPAKEHVFLMKRKTVK
jgi:hypothetical protein